MDTSNDNHHFDSEASDSESPPHGATGTLPQQADRDLQLATGQVLAGQPIPPSGWKILPPDLAKVEGTDLARAACVWLHHAPDSELTDLESRVGQLREDLGADTPIVIVERNIKLRQAQGIRLLQSGASLILPDLPIRDLARLGAALGRLRIQHPAAQAPGTVPQAEPLKGYLPAPDFARHVRQRILADSPQGIHNAVVRFLPLPGFSAAEVAQAYTPHRDQDLFTLDQQHLYIFLNACMDSDIDTALEHLFSLPLGQLFERDQRLVAPSDIMESLDALRSAPRLPEPSGVFTTQVDPVAPAAITDTKDSRRCYPVATPTPLDWILG
jgi:hypothetical protein